MKRTCLSIFFCLSLILVGSAIGVNPPTDVVNPLDLPFEM